MAQRIILILLLLILVVWLGSAISGAAALHQALAAPWPYGLGTVDAALSRSHGGAPSFQALQLQDAIERFKVPEVAPATAMQYTSFETSVDDDDSGGKRPGPITFATLQRPELQAIARSIVSAGDGIVLGKGDTTKPTIRQRYAVSNFAQLLGAAALMRDNPNAWTDAQAMWILARALGRPSDAYTKRLSIELQENVVAHQNYVLRERFSPLGIGHWPEAMPGIETSRCSDNRWIYKVDEDDEMTLKMSWEVGMEPGTSTAPALAFRYD